jgi:hypothetical protein
MMQDCPKCGKKIKTLYERHGAKSTFEAMGYYCKRCGILYDKELKKSASASSMLAAGATQTVISSEQDRNRFGVELSTVASKQNAAQRVSANMRETGPEGSGRKNFRKWTQ